MSLKLGPLPDRNPVKLSLSLKPDVHEALCDYASLHAKAHGQEAPLSTLAALMIEEFLNSDSAFKRARKTLEREANGKE
ncbi:MAG: DUF2274 domain-containing protein [Parvularculaceae bacterium]